MNEKQTQPIILIVVLNWNQKRETLACLHSLSAVISSHVCVLVIDNGSSDGSVDEIRSSYPDIQIIERPTNGGCAGGRNAGIRYALDHDVDYLLFLDNDTEVEAEFLARLVEVAQLSPQIGVVGSKILHFDDRAKVWAAGGGVDQNGYTEVYHYDGDIRDVPTDPYDVKWVPGCSMMVRRAALEFVGEFDESYFTYFEDIDWCTRAIAAGFRITVAPRSVVFHKISHAQGGHDSPGKRYFMSRNRLRFARQYAAPGRRYRALAWAVWDEARSSVEDLRAARLSGIPGRYLGIAHFVLGRTGPGPARWHPKR